MSMNGIKPDTSMFKPPLGIRQRVIVSISVGVMILEMF